MHISLAVSRWRSRGSRHLRTARTQIISSECAVPAYGYPLSPTCTHRTAYRLLYSSRTYVYHDDRRIRLYSVFTRKAVHTSLSAEGATILAAYATAWLLDAPTLPTRAALRAALDASRASRLSVSERCCSSSCCACQVKANHNRHAIHLHLQLHLRSDYQASQAPIRSASSLPPSFQPPACILPAPSTPSPHPPHLPEHPFEREWRWPWQRGAGRRGRLVLQPRG